MSRHAGDKTVLDLEHLRTICGEDPGFEREIVDSYLRQAESDVVRLGAALAASDVSALRFVAHALTGSSRSVGAVAFGDACAVLESLGKRGEIDEAPAALARALEEWEKLREELRSHRDRLAA